MVLVAASDETDSGDLRIDGYKRKKKRRRRRRKRDGKELIQCQNGVTKPW